MAAVLKQIGRPFSLLAAWLGGWVRLVLLLIVAVGILGGFLWERGRHPQTPEGALQVSSTIVGDIRQTTFRYPGTVDQVRAFYQTDLPPRGWQYCGTQITPRCSNIVQAATGAAETTDVYRQTGDQDFRGATIEVQPIPDANGQIYVTVFETRAR